MNRIYHHILLFLLIALIICPRQALSATDRDQEVRKAVAAFVTNRTAGMGWDVHLRRITISDALKLPEGPTDYEIVAPQQWEGWGAVSISVYARQKGKVVRNIPVRIEVAALVDTVVALREIEYGASILPSDVILQKREITYNSQLAARTLDEVIGKRARLIIRANQPVRTDQVERVPLIKSGQIVTIVAENEVLKVSVSGKARSSGAEGDIIRVQNLTSLKEIPAKVIDASTVQVAF